MTLDIVAKIGGLASGMSQAERITAKRSKEMQAHIRAFTVAMGVGLEHAFEGAVGLLGDVVKATIDAEKAQTQLAQAFKTSGGASGQSLKSLRDTAETLQSITGVDDDVIASVQTLLLQFRHISGETFPEATKAVLDFSARMGVDLPTAATAVGKALENPISGLKALKAAGVDLSESQQDTIKKLVETGHAAEAQKIVLDELAKSVGGAAEAARNTLGGALAALKVSADNLLEGDSGGEGLKGLVQSVNDLNDTINDPSIKSGVQDLIQDLAKLAEFTVKGAAAFGGLSEAIGQAFTANQQKSYDGALHRLYEIDSALGDIKKHGVALWEPLGTTTKDLLAERAEVQARLAQIRAVQTLGSVTGGVSSNTPIVLPTVEIHGGSGFGSGHGAAAGHKAATDAARAQADAERDLNKQLAELAKASDDINAVLQDQAREMGGPAVDAAIAYRDTMVKLQASEDELRTHGELTVDAQASIALARDQANDSYQKQIAAIDAVKSPLQQLMDQQQHELDILGLTGAALQTANDLYGQSPEEIAKYGAAIKANNQQLEDVRKNMDALQEERDTVSNFFQDFAKNGTSALDRLAEHIEDLIFKQLGDRLAKSLFPDSSAGGGSSGGGWISGLLSAFSSSGSDSAMGMGAMFGGDGFANGTDFAPGGYAWVGERGRELVNLPRGSQVIPNHRLGAMGGLTQNFHEHYAAPDDPRTRAQRAADVGRETSRVMRRNGI